MIMGVGGGEAKSIICQTYEHQFWDIREGKLSVVMTQASARIISP